MAHDRAINKISIIYNVIVKFSAILNNVCKKKLVKRMTRAKRVIHPHYKQKWDKSEHCWTLATYNIQNCRLFS